MAVTLRKYSPEPFFTEDYKKVRDFLIRINAERIYTSRMLWGAWEWAVTHQERDQNNLDRIGLWEDNGKLVAVATYECPLGEGYFMVDEDYSYLKHQLISYAKTNLQDKDGNLKLILPDGDYDFARAAREHGFRPTQKKDNDAALDINALQSYTLPDGFSFTSMAADDWNWYQCHRVIRRGFGNGERPNYDNETMIKRRRMFSSPMINPNLVVCVKAPDGNYVSHCTVWYRPGDFYCYVEPVATDPDYRMMGLGKAAVLEAVKRAGDLGAKQADVGSSQQFYYNIGFYPTHTLTQWELVMLR